MFTVWLVTMKICIALLCADWVILFFARANDREMLSDICYLLGTLFVILIIVANLGTIVCL